MIAATGEAARCRAALAALLPVCREWDVEVLVVRPAAVTDALPVGVVVVPAPAGEPVEGYPSLGLTVAKGDLVLLTTDDDVPNLDWNEILLHRLGMVAQTDADASVQPDGADSEVGKPVA